MADNCLVPSPGETVAISLKPKTAALVYPRVWCPSEQWVPDEVRCYGGTTIEDPHHGLPPLYNLMGRIGGKARRVISQDELIYIVKSFHETFNRPADDERNVLPLYLRSLAYALSHRWDTPVIPVFSSQEDQQRAFFKGDRIAVFLALKDIPIVDETMLIWDQVLEFRKDQAAKERYDNFIRWLDRDMVNRSQGDLEEKISSRLVDYEKALKKHGIRTVLGTIKKMLDVAIIVTAIVADQYNLGPFPTAGLAAVNFFVNVAKERCDYEGNIKRGPNFEISWVHEVKQLEQPKKWRQVGEFNIYEKDDTNSTGPRKTKNES